MITGNGSFILSQRSVAGSAPPAPPFDPTSAENGVSIDPVTGRIVLGDSIGGGLANFLNDREIEMSGFDFQFLNSGDKKFVINNAVDRYQLGDIDNAGFGTFLDIWDLSETFRFLHAGNRVLDFDLSQPLGGFFRLGDIDTAANSTQLLIDDFLQLVEIGQGINTRPGLFLDFANSYYAIGDPLNYAEPVVSAEVVAGGPITTQYAQNGAGTLTAYQELGVVNGTILPRWYTQLTGAVNEGTLRVTDEKLEVTQNKGSIVDMLNIDFITDSISIGDSVTNTFPSIVLDAPAQNITFYSKNGADEVFNEFNGTNKRNYFTIYDGVTTNDFQHAMDSFSVSRGAGSLFPYFLLDFILQEYSIGDITGSDGNGSHIKIDDAANLLTIRNTANNLGIEINGTAGFTGTVTPVNSITVDNGIVTNVS